jgi:hypothetical protein
MTVTIAHPSRIHPRAVLVGLAVAAAASIGVTAAVTIDRSSSTDSTTPVPLVSEIVVTDAVRGLVAGAVGQLGASVPTLTVAMIDARSPAIEGLVAGAVGQLP